MTTLTGKKRTMTMVKLFSKSILKKRIFKVFSTYYFILYFQNTFEVFLFHIFKIFFSTLFYFVFRKYF